MGHDSLEPGTIIKLRRDTALNWTTDNPVLAVGETGWETDTRRVKLGDGVTAWVDLPYAIDGPEGEVDTVAGVAPVVGDVPAASLKTALNLPTDTASDLTSLDTRVDATELADANDSAFRAHQPIATRRRALVPNMVTNPRLASSSTGWATSGFGTGGVGTATRVADAGLLGVGDYGWVTEWTVAPTGSATNIGPANDRAAAIVGQPYNGSIWVKSTIAFTVSHVVAFYAAAAGGSPVLQSESAVDLPANEWVRVQSSPPKICPTGAGYVATYIRINDLNGFGTNTITLSRAMVTAGRNLTVYADTTVDTGLDQGFGVAWGDSMVQLAHGGGLTFCEHLADALGVPVLNRGRGGESSAGIAIRQGGVEPLVTFPSDQIPASGAATVTVDVDPGLYFRADGAWNFYGHVAGVYGTLTRAITTGVWTFTRAVDDVAVDLQPGGSPFASITTEDYTDFAVIWLGTNDIDNGTVDGVLQSAGAAVARSKALGQAFVMIGPLNNSTEGIGTDGHAFVVAAAAALSDQFGDTYIDLRAWLIADGLEAAGIVPTGADLAAIADDRIPPSLLYIDGIHLNDAGREVAALRVASYLSAHAPTSSGQSTATPVVVAGMSVIVPPTTHLNPALAAWPSANRAIFNRFSVTVPTTIRYINWAVGVSSGNIQVGIVALSGSGHATASVVASSGVIGCPATGIVSTDLGAQALAPGEYAVFFWANNTTVTTRLGTSGNMPAYQLCNQVSSLASGVVGSVGLAAWNLNQSYFGCTLMGDI